MTGSVAAYDPSDPEHVEAISRLHAELLPDSPIPRLGGLFMKRFYYKRLVEAGMVHCEFFKVDGRYAAFSVWTEYPHTFMRRGRKRFFFFICGVLLAGILQSPKRIGTVLEVMKQSQNRGLEEDKGVTGEYLSLGILPEFAHAKEELTGLRVPNAMFERAISYFRAKRFKDILLVIRKSNKKSQRFYHSYGAAIKAADFVPADCYLMAVQVQA